MRTFIIFLFALVFVASCKNDDSGILKANSTSSGLVVQNVTVTSDTLIKISPVSSVNRIALALSWSGSTAGTSSVTTVVIQEAITDGRWYYCANTDTLGIDTVVGGKLWICDDFTTNLVGLRIGTFSGTTTKFTIHYSTR